MNTTHRQATISEIASIVEQLDSRRQQELLELAERLISGQDANTAGAGQ